MGEIPQVATRGTARRRRLRVRGPGVLRTGELDQDLGPERYDERRTSRLLEHAASLQDSSVLADSQNSVLREPVRSAQFGSQCTLPISHPDGGASWFRLLSSYLTCWFLECYMGDSVACVPAFSRAGSGLASVNCRLGERLPNQKQALHGVVKRGARRESDASEEGLLSGGTGL